ncbi:MAG: uracil phosphoribosyltransferase [Epulopiscium sp. Nele67-Bin005]|nr:MAG: uracil phosphoribosyltransferase [Epulopiscium sp. Nele67-Bin005]
MSKVFIIDHPLIQHKISHLRAQTTGAKEVRELTREISQLMCYEATRNVALEDFIVETPLGPTTGKRMAGKSISIVPILRAGLGMVDGILDLVPTAKVGHIGLYRDPETLQPVEYYCKLPEGINERSLYVLDPMLATGGSAVAAIDFLKEKGAKKINFVCLIAAPEGLDKLQKAHPDINIYIASLDEKIDENGYIVPGPGDAGDRLFGTK